MKTSAPADQAPAYTPVASINIEDDNGPRTYKAGDVVYIKASGTPYGGCTGTITRCLASLDDNDHRPRVVVQIDQNGATVDFFLADIEVAP